jgi:hypothetical protein
MFTKLLQLSLGLLLLGGCAYHEGQQVDINNPIVRKVGWFSYLDGNDIREVCAKGGSERYRLVYNGQYDEQLRTYELYVSQDGSGILNARALNGGAPLQVSTSDPFAPWDWKQSQVKLTAAEVADFRALLKESGYGGGAPQGLKLHSRDFYWVVAGCQNGNFQYDAWNNRPQSMAPGGFSQIKFVNFLLKHDQTGLAFRPEHTTTPIERDFYRSGGDDAATPKGTFVLTVRGDGLGGILNAF